MKWKVQGADHATGATRTIFVDAKDQAAAEDVAISHGIYVSEIGPAHASNPIRVPKQFRITFLRYARLYLSGPRLRNIGSAMGAAAFFISIFAAYRAWPISGKGLSAYDFSTPDNSLRSQKRMEINGDIRAGLELQSARLQEDREKNRKQLDSIKVERIVECDGKSAVFYSMAVGGLDNYQVEWLKRGEDGSFRPDYVSTFGWDGEAGEHGRIGKMIKDWEAKGHP